jgi:predicted nucleic acid-binding protein
MVAATKIYLDANVFISTIERRFSQEICDGLTELMMRPGRKSPFIVTSELTFSEVLVRPMREEDADLVAIYENIIVDGPVLSVGPINRETLFHASRLRANHVSLKLPDAIHLSTAFNSGCDHFLTSDLRIEGSYELQDDGADFLQKSKQLKVLRPTLDVVNHLLETAF